MQMLQVWETNDTWEWSHQKMANIANSLKLYTIDWELTPLRTLWYCGRMRSIICRSSYVTLGTVSVLTSTLGRFVWTLRASIDAAVWGINQRAASANTAQLFYALTPSFAQEFTRYSFVLTYIFCDGGGAHNIQIHKTSTSDHAFSCIQQLMNHVLQSMSDYKHGNMFFTNTWKWTC